MPKVLAEKGGLNFARVRYACNIKFEANLVYLFYNTLNTFERSTTCREALASASLNTRFDIYSVTIKGKLASTYQEHLHVHTYTTAKNPQGINYSPDCS